MMFTDSQINKARHTIKEQDDLYEACHRIIPRTPIELERFMNAHNWFWNGIWWIKDPLLWKE